MKKLVKRLAYLYQSQKRLIIYLFFLRFFNEAIKLIGPFLNKYVIDGLIALDKDKIKFILVLVAASFIINILTSFFGFLISKFSHKFQIGIGSSLRLKAHHKLLDLPMAFHESENTHKKLNKIGQGITEFQSFTSNILFEVVPTFLQTLLTFLVILFMNWQLSIVFLIFIPPFLFVTWYMNKKARPIRKALRGMYHNRQRKMGESINYIRTVQEFVQEDREKQKLSLLTDGIVKKELLQKNISLKYDFFRDSILNIARFALMTLGVFQTLQGSITPGSLVMFFMYSERAYASLYRLTRFYDAILDGLPAIEELSEIFEKKSEINDLKDTFEIKYLEGDVIFDNVSFSYKSANGTLSGVNFHIKPHEIVAFVGPSGSGKSTLIKLIYRHFDVTAGKIMLDGIDIRRLKRSSFRKKLAIVPQDIDVFDETILENIKYAFPKATKKQVEVAAKASFLHDFIVSLPQGYKTPVGERGVKLSGGQKQRVGIARALLANPAILILDEATSSLDSESEMLIQKAIDKIARQCTMIIIAHRLSTIRNADKIIVLDKGRIVEEGTHEMLKNATGGLYSKLYYLQTKGVII